MSTNPRRTRNRPRHRRPINTFPRTNHGNRSLPLGNNMFHGVYNPHIQWTYPPAAPSAFIYHQWVDVSGVHGYYAQPIFTQFAQPNVAQFAHPIYSPAHAHNTGHLTNNHRGNWQPPHTSLVAHSAPVHVPVPPMFQLEYRGNFTPHPLSCPAEDENSNSSPGQPENTPEQPMTPHLEPNNEEQVSTVSCDEFDRLADSVLSFLHL